VASLIYGLVDDVLGFLFIEVLALPSPSFDRLPSFD
jgi:hypothetical protein